LIIQRKIITTQHYFFHELNSTFFHRFLVANYNHVLSFFPARQAFEIFFNESFKSTENALNGCVQKDTTKYFPKYLWFCPNSRNFGGFVQIPGKSDGQKQLKPHF
jgi:hypothetical protein